MNVIFVVITIVIMVIMFYFYWLISSAKFNPSPFSSVWEGLNNTHNSDGHKATELLQTVTNILGDQYFLMYGTLLGAMRHNGFIDWDDDIDIAVSKHIFDSLPSFEREFNKHGIGLIRTHKTFYKVYFFGSISVTKPTIRGTWGWPFVDLFYYETNGMYTIISNNDAPYKKIETSDIFPLKSIQFNQQYGDYFFNVPKHSGKILSLFYKDWDKVCISNRYDHKLEKTVNNVTKIDCSRLINVSDNIFNNVYVINLDRRPDRYNTTDNRLKSIGIDAIRWKAVDSKSDEFGRFYDNIKGNKKTRSEVACYLSHFNLWTHLYDMNVPYSIIFEDDIIFTPIVTKELIMKEIKNSKGFDILLLGHCYSNDCSEKNLSCVGHGQCLNAYVISRNGLKVLLKDKPDFSIPIDRKVDNLARSNKLFCFISYTSKTSDMYGKGIILQDNDVTSDIIKNNKLFNF